MRGRDLFIRLLRECFRFPGQLAAAAAALALVALSQLYLTWIVKVWLEGPFVGKAGPPAGMLKEAAAVTVVMVVGLFLSRYLVARVNQSLLVRLRDLAVRRLLAARVSGLRRYPSGELISRVFSDAGSLGGFVEAFLKRFVGDGLDLVGALAVLFVIHWRLALAACVLVPLLAAVLSRIGKVIRRWGALAQQEVGDLHSTLDEELHGMSTIKGYKAEAFEAERFAAQNRRYFTRVMRAEWWSAFLLATIFLVTGAALLLVVWYGSRLALAKELTTASLLGFCLFAARTIEPLRRLSEVQGMLQRSLASAARLYELIDLPLVEDASGESLPEPVRGAVSFEGVKFRYHDEKPLLEGFDLVIRPGETVAIVATSGGGKSTLANLLVRHIEPVSGRLRLDGLDIRTLSLEALRGAVSVVEQEPFLFRATLAENILYGSWGKGREAVTEAARLAGLAELAGSLPGGLDAELSEAGRNLSGGQRQRISLARAVLKDAPVVVLDEATSALDSETEARVLDQLAPWLLGRTVIVMAHRLSTISRFPRVVVLDAGRVVGDGTASALVETCPPFARLFAEQFDPVPLSIP